MSTSARQAITARGWIAIAAVIVVLLGLWWLLGSSGGTSGDDDASTTQQMSTSTAASAPAATSAVSGTDPHSGLPVIAIDDLPPEALETITLINQGGPFPYDKDGATFGNYEQLLPDQSDGYYQEYTVPTPGSDDRGARRIVTGEGGEMYYTDDHYESFSLIAGTG